MGAIVDEETRALNSKYLWGVVGGAIVFGLVLGVVTAAPQPSSRPTTTHTPRAKHPPASRPSVVEHNSANHTNSVGGPGIVPGKLTPKQLKLVKSAIKEFVVLLKKKPNTPSFSCEPKCTYKAKVVWDVKVPELVESSPRAADLNGDGVLDFVVGTGVFSMGGGPYCYVYALSGKDGSVLWRRQFSGDMYATPTLLDINGDNVKDVVMAGRIDNVYAMDGKTGRSLWDLRKKNPDKPFPKANFNTSVIVSDIDKDGTPDLLTIQGGEVTNQGITIGRLFQVSGKTGKILKMEEVPDRREIYAIPSFYKGKKRTWLYVGTGGERIPGHMFALEFPSFRKVWKYQTYSKGIIASPLVYHFKGRPYPDVIAGIFDGRMVRLDGQTGAVQWKFQTADRESYTSPAVGRFHSSKRRDVITAYYKGVWPRYEQSNLYWIHSGTGKVLHKRPFGTFSLSSPLIADLNGDGRDEVIVSTNAVDQAMLKEIDRLSNIIRPALGDPMKAAAIIKGKLKRPSFLPPNMPTYESPFYAMRNTLVIFDGKTRKIHWSKSFAKQSSSTPLLMDVDRNGKVDLIYVVLGRLIRLEFQLKVPSKSLRWNQFRGPRGDGVFRP